MELTGVVGLTLTGLTGRQDSLLGRFALEGTHC